MNAAAPARVPAWITGLLRFNCAVYLAVAALNLFFLFAYRGETLEFFPHALARALANRSSFPAPAYHTLQTTLAAGWLLFVLNLPMHAYFWRAYRRGAGRAFFEDFRKRHKWGMYLMPCHWDGSADRFDAMEMTWLVKIFFIVFNCFVVFVMFYFLILGGFDFVSWQPFFASWEPPKSVILLDNFRTVLFAFNMMVLYCLGALLAGLVMAVWLFVLSQFGKDSPANKR